MNDSWIHWNMKISRDDNAIHFHSKGGRCKFWGLIRYADRRLPRWACLDGPQHDRSSSDTVMISMNFDTYSSLALFFIICFVLFLNIKLYILHECYQCLIFITVRNLQSSWACEPSKLELSISFSHNKENCGAWYVYKSLFGSSVATCRLVCSEVSLSINEKKLERSPGKVGTI